MTANATGTKVPTSAKSNRNLAIRRCMFCYAIRTPRWGKHRTEA